MDGRIDVQMEGKKKRGEGGSEKEEREVTSLQYTQWQRVSGRETRS